MLNKNKSNKSALVTSLSKLKDANLEVLEPIIKTNVNEVTKVINQSLRKSPYVTVIVVRHQ
jgi:hypothetical protein